MMKKENNHYEKSYEHHRFQGKAHGGQSESGSVPHTNEAPAVESKHR
jgi:hypothetical protein